MPHRIPAYILTLLTILFTIPQTSTAQFTDITTAAGLDGIIGSEAVAWGDYNQDGHLDFFAARAGLYRNNGNATFTDVTGTAFLDPTSGLGLSAAWADYDNDGFIDLYIGSGTTSQLYRNNGDGTLSNVAVAAGVNAPSISAIAWGDYNNDGQVDLYLGHVASANSLYRNNGDGTFSDVTAGAGVAGPDTEARAVSWADYDMDGFLDIFIVHSINGPAPNKNNILFKNNGDGTFTDVAGSLGIDDVGDGVGAAWGDYDNDADLDLYVAARGANHFYENDGDGTFTDVTGSSLAVGINGDGQPSWGDYDNDGLLDLNLATDDTNIMYHNNGDGTFTDLASALGVDIGGGSGGAPWADIDGDGDLDFFVSNWTTLGVLFRNDDSNNSNWLQIELVGRESNQSAIGATVLTVVGQDNQFRVVNGGERSQSQLPLAFGLGEAALVDEITVTWPTGVVQTVSDVAANQLITIFEPLHATLGVGEALGSPGGTAVVGIELTADGPVAGLQFTVQAIHNEEPTELVTFQGVLNNVEGEGFTATAGTDEETGETTVLVFSLSGGSIPTPDHRTIVELAFAIDEEMPSGDWIDVVISEGVVSDPDTQPGSVTHVDGAIRIGSPGDIAGGTQGEGDGLVNIVDLVKLIQYVLGTLPVPSDFALFVADINEDGDLNVLDIVGLIDLILGEGPSKALVTGPTGPVIVSMNNVQIQTTGQAVIPISVETNGLLAAMEATLTFDPSRLQPGTPRLTGLAQGMTIESHIADGTMRIVIFSADGQSIHAGKGALFLVPVTMINGGTAGATFTLSDVLVSDAQAQMVAVDLRTDAVKATSTPSAFSLGANSPNPFNPATTISYEVPAQAHITLTVYNLLGQEVVRLVNTDQAPGRYSVVWNGTNAAGSIVASGVYLYRLTGSTGYSETKRMLLLK